MKNVNDLSKNLTDHFILAEFVVSQTASRLRIDNTPSNYVIKNLTKLCESILEPARVALGPLKVSSGYRCAELNSAIGGAKNSAHLEGFAADIIPLKVNMKSFARWIIKNVPFDQLILEFGSLDCPSWIHVSADPKQRKQILRILNSEKGYEQIKFEDI